MTDLFRPLPGQGATLAATTTSGFVTLAKGTAALWVYNAGPDAAYVVWGTGAQTAGTSDMVIGAGMGAVFGQNLTDDTFAARSLTTTATLYVISGNGE